ncbi:hypothetical protein [Tenacibaculum ovolyticum]|uniref:hypothetical protein n=1 Tax=Tenacibaculum ovolyticum TaxID=104270 RepID=UPI003BA9FAFA
MNIEGINLTKIKTPDFIEYLSKNQIKKPSNSEFKRILKEFNICIEKGKFKLSLNTLILILFLNSKQSIEFIRKKGIFRYSKYKGKKCIIADLISQILSLNKDFLNLSSYELNYLHSILNFSNSHNTYTSVDKFILKEVKRFELYYKEKSFLKTLLTFIDFLFLSNHNTTSKIDLLSIKSRSKESISMAISYLIYFISERTPSLLKDTNKANIPYINTSEFQNLIVLVCTVQDFKEFEILIDNFNYSCIKNENNIRLKAPKKDFEKSIKLGYIKSDLQSFNDVLNSKTLNDETVLSIEDLVEELYSIEKNDIFQYTESNNYPRYRIVMPEPVIDFFIENYFIKDILFKDEIIYLSHINKEQLLHPNNLDSIIIKGDLTLFDIVKFRRFFSFFYELFTKKLFEYKKITNEVLLSSLIPTITEDELYNYLERFSTRDKVDSFLDIVTWEPEMDIIFDLQYHPLLFINDSFLIPLTIFHHSNFVRNLFASEYKKNNKQLLSDGTFDVLVNELSISFSKSKIENYSETSLPKSDIDLFAIYDDTLYVFECKHSLQPVNSFDLRTTFDYIKKAEKQLDYVQKLYYEGVLIQLLENKHNINLSNINKIVCTIVLSNRLFNGNVFKYPVRYINEIKNIINEGIIKTEKGNFRLWTGDTLSNSDLTEYFSLKSNLVKLLFDSVTEEILVYDLIQPPLEVETYSMNMKYAVNKLDEFTSTLKKIDDE